MPWTKSDEFVTANIFPAKLFITRFLSRFPPGVNKSLEVLNGDVSVHNDVCPEGYRLPNMTELLLMSALLPESYWANGSNYICRSYFSLGVLGESSKRKTSESVTVKKIGWAYYTQVGNKRVHLKNQGAATYKFRCVQDDYTKRLIAAIPTREKRKRMHG